MASTYSSLKIELIGTGDQSGTWGQTTNNNFQYAVEEAITGTADVTFASLDVTLTLADNNASQTARNLRLNLVGTSGAARILTVPAIEKQYIINNGLAHQVTVQNSTGTGVVIPAGKSAVVFNNGTNVLPVSTAIPVSSTLTFSFPSTDGTSGKPVVTDGSGNLSFPANGAFVITGERERAVDLGSGNTAAIDLNLGNYFYKTVTANTTITLSNVPANLVAQSFILELTNGSAFAVTYFANLTFPSAVPPTLTGGRDVLGFFTRDGGTTWSGFTIGLNMQGP
jgi:hypothetical protein